MKNGLLGELERFLCKVPAMRPNTQQTLSSLTRFFQQMFPEHLLCVRHSSRHWRQRHEQSPCPRGAYSLDKRGDDVDATETPTFPFLPHIKYPQQQKGNAVKQKANYKGGA